MKLISPPEDSVPDQSHAPNNRRDKIAQREQEEIAQRLRIVKNCQRCGQSYREARRNGDQLGVAESELATMRRLLARLRANASALDAAE